MKKGPVGKYEYVFESLEDLKNKKLISENLCEIFGRMFGACELFDRHKFCVDTVTVELIPSSANKMLEHMDNMQKDGCIDSKLHDELCRLIKRYRALKNEVGKKPYPVNAATAYNAIWDEVDYYKEMFASFNFAQKREIKRRNPDLYPYINEVRPEKVESPYVPYPIYKWDMGGKARVAGETLIHKFGLRMRPTKVAQFNAVVALAQDHGGVSGTPFYAECVRFFRDGCKGQSKKGRAYDFMRYVRELMRAADQQFYYSLTGTTQIVPVKDFIEACAVKLLELQKIINN